MQITIFTDGSSRGNPGPGGWGGLIVTTSRSVDTSKVQELGGRESHTTNNRMEITAALEALKSVEISIHGGSQLSDSAESSWGRKLGITIYTDSRYLINGITKWVKGWQAKGWKTTAKEEVQNRDLWEDLIEVVGRIEKLGGTISWNYVGGHVGIAGNERCDEIATAFADATGGAAGSPELYDGALSAYSISNILDISMDSVGVDGSSAEKSEKKSRSKAKAYSYISAIAGKVMVHQSWAECEARVKGKSGARFKKALSAGEERAIVAEFSTK